MQALRYYQEEAIEAMTKTGEGSVGCVVMPCGTGKTAVITKYIEREMPRLSVIIFPRLALIDQYVRGYTLDGVKYIVVGTNGYSAVNDGERILREIERNPFVIILTTYISIIPLSRLLEPRDAALGEEDLEAVRARIDYLRENLENDRDGVIEELAELQADLIRGTMIRPPRIDLVVYDESHHTNTDKQEAAERFLSPIKTFYFTATPVDNHHNIIYKYSYHQALQDGYSRPFIISIYATAQPKTPKTVYEMLGYFAKKLNLSNTIVFHRYSNIEGDETGTSVDDYVRYEGYVGDGAGEGAIWDIEGDMDIENDRGAADDLEEYLPDGTEIVCIKGSTPIPHRLNILERAKSDDNYMIIHTCKTMSEGVDTQKIESICILDEMSDEVATTQAIGRIMRKDVDRPDAPSYLLIPFFGVEGRGGVEKRDSIYGFANTELKKRKRAKKSSGGGVREENPDYDLPRWAPPVNETFNVNLNLLERNSQGVTISGILSFFAKDNPENEVKNKLDIDELHKQVSAFEIEAYHAENGGVNIEGIPNRRIRKNVAVKKQPKIEYYGCNEPLGNRNPKTVMISLANEFVKVFKQDLVEGKRTGTPKIYAFADFISDVVENNDKRYRRYKEIEELFDHELGENWEYGIYGKPPNVDERIIDLVTNKRFGFPIIIPDRFNTLWGRVFEEAMDDKDFVSAWKERNSA